MWGRFIHKNKWCKKHYREELSNKIIIKIELHNFIVLKNSRQRTFYGEREEYRDNLFMQRNTIDMFKQHELTFHLLQYSKIRLWYCSWIGEHFLICICGLVNSVIALKFFYLPLKYQMKSKISCYLNMSIAPTRNRQSRWPREA